MERSNQEHSPQAGFQNLELVMEGLDVDSDQGLCSRKQVHVGCI